MGPGAPPVVAAAAPHGEQPRERVVGPLELFYDLVVVVLVAQAAHHLAGELDWHGLGLFAAVFALVWIAWFNGSLHHELHGHEDARGRSMFLLQILVLVPLGAFIPEAGAERGTAFAVDAGVLFAVLALLWLLASRSDTPEFRRPSMLYVTGTAACAVVLAASAALPADARVLTWGALAVVYLAGFVFVIARAIPEEVVALSVTAALTERFGLFIIIVLGENVTGVVDGLAHEPTNALTLAVGLVAVVVGFGAWWTYFDFAGHRLPRPTRACALLWMMVHLPITAAVAAMGAAMVGLVEHAHDSRTPAATAWVLCGGAAVVLCATMVLAASLRHWNENLGLYRPWPAPVSPWPSCVWESAPCARLRSSSAWRSSCSSASPGESPWPTAWPTTRKNRPHDRAPASGRRGARLGPVDHQPAFGEVPVAVLLGELVEVADGGDHQRALPGLVDPDVMGQAVALARRPVVAVQGNGALAVEVRGGPVGVEVVEHRGQGLAPVQGLRRLGGRGVHEHQEAGVLGEQAHLALGVPPVRAVRVGVDQLADGQPVGGFPG
jgi:low temperature requirement protein LtrA